MGRRKKVEVVEVPVEAEAEAFVLDINNPEHANLVTHPGGHKAIHLVEVAQEVSRARKER